MQPSQPSGSAGGANASSSGMTGGGVQSAAFPEIARAAALSAPAVSFPFGPVPLQQGPSRLPAHGSPGSLAAVPELPQAGVSMRFPWGGSVEALTLSAAAAAAPVAARGLLPPLPSAMSLGSLGGPLPRFMDGLDGQGAFPWMGLSRSVGGSVAYGAPSPSAWPPAMRQAPFVAPGGTASAPQLWPVVVAPTHQTDQMNQNLTEGKVASRKRNVDGTAASRTALPNGDGGGNSSTGVSADGFLDRPAAAAAPAPKREIKTCTKGHVYVVPLADCRSPSDDERSRLAEKISTDEPPHQKRKLCDSNEEEGESKARVGGTGSSSDASVECPYCSGKLFSVERCLADTHPDVAAEWHYVRNDGLCSAAGTPLTPYTILPGCNRKVWWLCAEGHEWEVMVNDRTRRRPSRCPFCTGRRVTADRSLLALCPEVAALWHPTRNLSLRDRNGIPVGPDRVSPNSDRRVWWRSLAGAREWQGEVRVEVRKARTRNKRSLTLAKADALAYPYNSL